MDRKSKRSRNRRSNTPRSRSSAGSSNVIDIRSKDRSQHSQRQSPRTKRTKSRKRRQRERLPVRSFKLPAFLLYPLQLLIMGAGVSAIVGTALTLGNQEDNFNPAPNPEATSEQTLTEVTNSSATAALPLKTPLDNLATVANAAIAAAPGLDATLLFVDLDSGAYLDIAGDRPISAASTIKFPVLVAFLEAVDNGEANLWDTLVLTDSVRATEAGAIQFQPDGTTYSALTVATEMSVNSDNSATNMIIQHLGGNETLNSRFRQWGMTQTKLNNPLPDMDGTNLTTAKDLAHLSARVNKGEILSLASRDRLFRIMGATSNNRLLAQTIGPQSHIIHKTGDIGTTIGDAGIVVLPNGKQYIAAIFVESEAYNDPGAKPLLQNIGRQFYQFMEQGR